MWLAALRGLDQNFAAQWINTSVHASEGWPARSTTRSALIDSLQGLKTVLDREFLSFDPVLPSYMEFSWMRRVHGVFKSIVDDRGYLRYEQETRKALVDAFESNRDPLLLVQDPSAAVPPHIKVFALPSVSLSRTASFSLASLHPRLAYPPLAVVKAHHAVTKPVARAMVSTEESFVSPDEIVGSRQGLKSNDDPSLLVALEAEITTKELARQQQLHLVSEFGRYAFAHNRVRNVMLEWLARVRETLRAPLSPEELFRRRATQWIRAQGTRGVKHKWQAWYQTEFLARVPKLLANILALQDQVLEFQAGQLELVRANMDAQTLAAEAAVEVEEEKSTPVAGKFATLGNFQSLMREVGTGSMDRFGLEQCEQVLNGLKHATALLSQEHPTHLPNLQTRQHFDGLMHEISVHTLAAKSVLNLAMDAPYVAPVAASHALDASEEDEKGTTVWDAQPIASDVPDAKTAVMNSNVVDGQVEEAMVTSVGSGAEETQTRFSVVSGASNPSTPCQGGRDQDTCPHTATVECALCGLLCPTCDITNHMSAVNRHHLRRPSSTLATSATIVATAASAASVVDGVGSAAGAALAVTPATAVAAAHTPTPTPGTTKPTDLRMYLYPVTELLKTLSAATLPSASTKLRETLLKVHDSPQLAEVCKRVLAKACQYSESSHAHTDLPVVVELCALTCDSLTLDATFRTPVKAFQATLNAAVQAEFDANLTNFAIIITVCVHVVSITTQLS
jgi:hypothetical protein